MRLRDAVTDQQLAVLALLGICALAVASGGASAKEILLAVASAIAGWMSRGGGA